MPARTGSVPRRRLARLPRASIEGHVIARPAHEARDDSSLEGSSQPPKPSRFRWYSSRCVTSILAKSGRPLEKVGKPFDETTAGVGVLQAQARIGGRRRGVVLAGTGVGLTVRGGNRLRSGRDGDARRASRRSSSPTWVLRSSSSVRFGRIPSLPRTAWYALTASTGPITPSTIRRRNWTKASWFSALLIFRPKRATLAPYFWASARSWKASRVVPAEPPRMPIDEVRVVPEQLLHRPRPVVDDLEEQRAAGRRDPGEHPGDHVVEVTRQDLGVDGARGRSGRRLRGSSGTPCARPPRGTGGSVRGSRGRASRSLLKVTL